MSEFPFNLIAAPLGQNPAISNEQARSFCLDVIKEFYGIDYNPEWHVDLDSFLLTDDSHFSPANRGVFWTVGELNNTLVAAGAVSAITWKPRILEHFPARYPKPEIVAHVARVYVRKDWRNRGLGKHLDSLLETEAVRLGYSVAYLHASSNAVATIAFWRRSGYTPFGDHEDFTHFDKPLVSKRLSSAD
jgi:GNAT superfamily N-acetyltransferase